MKNLRLLLDLTVANLKMFIRDKGALFWSLFFPFLIIGVFGLFDFANLGNNNVGLVYKEETKAYAEQLKSIFSEGDRYKFHTGSLDDELGSLENDDRLVVLEFILDEGETLTVNSYVGKENEQAGEVFTLITEKVLTDISMQQQQIEPAFVVNQEVVNTNDLRFIDYMVPGVVALAIMQSALFGVIGAIVVNREKGILKRIFATPLNKSVYLISNIIARTIISLGQIAVILLISYLVFQITIVGNVFQVVFLATLGSLTFLALAILLSGFARTAESARAMVMPVQMLFMFTGGVYFSRSVLPDWLYDASSYFPLTYLADVLRETMVKGGTLSDPVIQTGMIGLTVWLIVLVVLSVRTFRWEIE